MALTESTITQMEHAPTRTSRLFTAGRERIFGDPPEWLKEILSDEINIDSIDRF